MSEPEKRSGRGFGIVVLLGPLAVLVLVVVVLVWL